MRTWRPATGGLLGLALIANLAAWCPCAPAASATSPDGAHGCCTPKAGLRAVCTDYCAGMAPASSVAAPEAAAPALSIHAAAARWTDTRPAIVTTTAPPAPRGALPTVLRV